jgi:hypothetical protein
MPLSATVIAIASSCRRRLVTLTSVAFELRTFLKKSAAL